MKISDDHLLNYKIGPLPRHPPPQPAHAPGISSPSSKIVKSPIKPVNWLYSVPVVPEPLDACAKLQAKVQAVWE